MNGSIQLQLPRFSGKHFDQWCIQMKALFCFQELSEVVDLGFLEPVSEAAAAALTQAQKDSLRDNRKKDKKALFFLFQAVDEIVFEKISGATTAKEAWDMLQKSYKGDEKVKSVRLQTLRVPVECQTDWMPRYSRIEAVDNYGRYEKLYKAARQGDWKVAQEFFGADPNTLRAPINENLETALHVAAGAGRSEFVEKMVDVMEPSALESSDLFGRTPLHVAAWVGNTDAVKTLLRKKEDLLYSGAFWSVLQTAARNAQRDTLVYLLEVIESADRPYHELFPNEDFTAHFLILVIESGYYDIALKLVRRYPFFAVSIRENGDCGLNALARNPSAFKSRISNQYWWQRIIYNRFLTKEESELSSNKKEEITSHIKDKSDDLEEGVNDNQVTSHGSNWASQHLMEYFWACVPCIKSIQDQKKMHLQALKLLKCLCAGVKSLNNLDAYNSFAKDAFFTAAKSGIHEVMEEIVKTIPDLIWAEDEDNLNIFQLAVLERHANVFMKLINQMEPNKKLIVRMTDSSENNLLHLAGKLAPQNKNNDQVISAALKMQRELQWFEEVKRLANPRDIDRLNKDKKTPRMLFTEQHEKLRAKGEKWMKYKAKSCTIPAILIITVVFTAAITVPGGLNINGDGLPVFSNEVVFNIFAAFNAISLCAAITSLLVSLSIQTSHCAQDEFLFALPHKLVIALVTLHLSITTMAVAFSSALYIMFGNKNKPLILFLVVAVAIIPIISFALLEFHLLLDLIFSTYCPRIFRKQSNRPFY